MKLLPQQLRPCLANRVCLVGVGNPRSGDGAVGVRVAEALSLSPAAPLPTPRNPDLPTSVPSPTRSTEWGLFPNLPFTQPPNVPPTAASRASIAILKAIEGPQRVLPEIVQGEFDHVVFIEALDFGGPPGDVVVLGSDEIASRYRSTPERSDCLASLTQAIEANGKTKSWLLGVQPASLKQDRPLSRSVACTVQALVSLLAQEKLPAAPPATSVLRVDGSLP